jgi:hypothetical protein
MFREEFLDLNLLRHPVLIEYQLRTIKSNLHFNSNRNHINVATLPKNYFSIKLFAIPFKGIVSPDWKGLQMFSLDRFEV